MKRKNRKNKKIRVEEIENKSNVSSAKPDHSTKQENTFVNDQTLNNQFAPYGFQQYDQSYEPYPDQFDPYYQDPYGFDQFGQPIDQGYEPYSDQWQGFGQDPYGQFNPNVSQDQFGEVYPNQYLNYPDGGFSDQGINYGVNPYQGVPGFDPFGYPQPMDYANSDTDVLVNKLAEINENLTRKILDRIENIGDRVRSNGEKIDQQSMSLQNQLDNIAQSQHFHSYPTAQPTLGFATPVYQPKPFNDQSSAVWKLAKINANLTKQILNRIDSIDDKVKRNGEKIDQQTLDSELLKVKLSHNHTSQNGCGQVCWLPKLSLFSEYSNPVESAYPCPPANSVMSYPLSPSLTNQEYYSERERASRRAINSQSPQDNTVVDELPYIGYTKHTK